MYSIEYLDIEKNEKNEKIISKVLDKCFEIENLPINYLTVSITLTNSNNIKEINKKFRKIDKPTDVLSFPMFNKSEIDSLKKEAIDKEYEILGDMVISIEQVQIQAEEYNHSFERELSYMVVHSFYHLLGYDHIEENDKKKMREKEEFILNKLNITRSK